jgi:hypothetical protein
VAMNRAYWYRYVVAVNTVNTSATASVGVYRLGVSVGIGMFRRRIRTNGSDASPGSRSD